MLIVNDCYFDLLGPQKLDMGGDLFLFNSKLGWILGGQTVNTTTERGTELHLLVGTLGMALGGVSMNVHALNSIDVLSISKPSLESFGALNPLG